MHAAITTTIAGAGVCGSEVSAADTVRAAASVEVSAAAASVAAVPDVEAQYQRRSDLIPNLVNTVKGYAAHEQSTFTEVVEARAQAMSFKLDAADLTPEKLAEFQQAQQKVGSALGRLIAVAEQYPDLKANQNFLELQAQLEGTENRIAVARTRFNDATRQYNVTIRRFPANLIAGMFGFDQKAYFAAEEGAQTVPEVKF